MDNFTQTGYKSRDVNLYVCVFFCATRFECLPVNVIAMFYEHELYKIGYIIEDYEQGKLCRLFSPVFPPSISGDVDQHQVKLPGRRVMRLTTIDTLQSGEIVSRRQKRHESDVRKLHRQLYAHQIFDKTTCSSDWRHFGDFRARERRASTSFV